MFRTRVLATGGVDKDLNGPSLAEMQEGLIAPKSAIRLWRSIQCTVI